MERGVDCRVTSVSAMVKVFMSGAKARGLNATACRGTCTSLRPSGGPPSLPQNVPEQTTAPSLRTPLTAPLQRTALPSSVPLASTPHASGVALVVVSAVTRVSQVSALLTMVKFSFIE